MAQGELQVSQVREKALQGEDAVIEGKTSNYTGTSTDINRERRLSEYQRAMMLRPAQREMVQARMIANPYERDSSTRLERINSRVNADPYVNSRTSQAFRDALAMREYEQPQSYSASGESDNGYARAQRRAAQSGGQFDPMNDVSVGEVNGRRVVAPQAGKYNGYNAFLAAMGLGDSPSPEAYSYAYDRSKIDPNEKYKADAMMSAAGAKNAQAQRKLDLEREKMQSQERIKTQQTMNKQGNDARKSINAVGGDKGYQGYLNGFKGALKDIKDMTTEDALAYFQDQGIPYSQAGGKFVPLPRNKWLPGVGDAGDPMGDAMRAASETPGGAVAVQDMLRKGAMSPAGQQVDAIYGRLGLGPNPALQQPQGAQQAPQAMNPQQILESDAQGLQQALVTLQQRGLSQQQAMQRIQQSIQNMPPDKRQRAMAVLQNYGDRILQTQQVR